MDDVIRDRLPSRTVLFPAYSALPDDTRYITVIFHDPVIPARPAGGPDRGFRITTPLHGSFHAEWPIAVNVPLALKGFRHALGLSQAKFADRTTQGRLNIERWEAGTSRPFRGHTLTLLELLRPLVDGSLSAGQLLNFAAAVVCPSLTRPAATYTGHEIASRLAGNRIDHTDLAPALLEALVSSEILIPLDDPDDGLGIRYVPLVGIRTLDRETEPWEAELAAIARRLEPSDRRLWLTIGRRLQRAELDTETRQTISHTTP